MDLQEIKNTYAQEQGYEDWNDLRKEFREKAITFTEMTGHENAVIIRAQKAALEKAAESRNKFFRTAEMRDLEMQLTKEEISYSRMIEIINEKAYNLYRASITNPENLIR